MPGLQAVQLLCQLPFLFFISTKLHGFCLTRWSLIWNLVHEGFLVLFFFFLKWWDFYLNTQVLAVYSYWMQYSRAGTIQSHHFWNVSSPFQLDSTAIIRNIVRNTVIKIIWKIKYTGCFTVLLFYCFCGHKTVSTNYRTSLWTVLSESKNVY